VRFPAFFLHAGTANTTEQTRQNYQINQQIFRHARAYKPTSRSTKQRSIPEGWSAADEGAPVEGRLEANVAEVVVVVQVVIHGPVHLGEILLDLVHGNARSSSRLGPGDPARVQALHDLEEPSAPVSICRTDRGAKPNPSRTSDQAKLKGEI
jgi:hypothetical protein